MTRRDLYAAVGAALSLGAPLGLLALRATQLGELSFAWLRDELAVDRTTYAYVCLSTLVAFAMFGFVLGRQADRLVELSTTDALTGLHNRRSLFERLRHEVARSARYDEPLSLVLIDVDGLKALNDREGHRAGDAALSLVGSAVRTGSRASDLPARWGGDEFALLAPNTGIEAAASLAERVRACARRGERARRSRQHHDLGGDLDRRTGLAGVRARGARPRGRRGALRGQALRAEPRRV